jgi:uncharacterized damage-inducible protein DinB
MALEDKIADSLVAASKRHLFDESWARIKKATDYLDSAELWSRPNEATNSVGNLILHLEGNVRQWIVSGLGGAPDDRDRDLEFAERRHLPKDEILAALERTLQKAESVIDRLDSKSLMDRHRIQGYDVSSVDVLVHVVEHFSYHVGQVTHIVKSLRGVDLAYYGDRDLNTRNKPE